MLGVIRYSVVVIVAFVLAWTAAYGVIIFFIPGFESGGLLPPLAGVVFIPLCVLLVLLTRKNRRRAG